MSSETPSKQTSEPQQQADFVQAFQEIVRGERAAAALENQLSSMEAKLDALLAEAERRQEEVIKAKMTAAADETSHADADVEQADKPKSSA